MVRQRKIKRKFVSLMLAASLAGSPLTMSPMNVFAGTGKNGVKKAPYNVISIQGDSSYCMKKGNQVELKKTLAKEQNLRYLLERILMLQPLMMEPLLLLAPAKRQSKQQQN